MRFRVVPTTSASAACRTDLLGLLEPHERAAPDVGRGCRCNVTCSWAATLRPLHQLLQLGEGAGVGDVLGLEAGAAGLEEAAPHHVEAAG